MTRKITLPPINKQLYAQQVLIGARTTQLDTGVSEVASSVSPLSLRRDALRCVPRDGLTDAQSLGIRDELVFALPSMLRRRPTLIGYYRMLLGYSIKQFYTVASGLSPFHEMESGKVPHTITDGDLIAFCKAYNETMSDFLTRASRADILKDLHDLPVMTLGVYVDGVWRNRVGQGAAASVAETVFDILTDAGYSRVSGTDNRDFVVAGPNMHRLHVLSSSDPDVSITELVGESERKVLCIEVKGGQDVANVHNRAGEAEKSHQKAKRNGWPRAWTVILWSSLSKDQRDKIKVEAPTTDAWFDVNEVCGQSGRSYRRFAEQLLKTVSQ